MEHFYEMTRREALGSLAVAGVVNTRVESARRARAALRSV